MSQIRHFLSLAGIGESSGSEAADLPKALRRNLVIKGINLTALRYQRFSIGDAIFEAGALCHPCGVDKSATALMAVLSKPR